MCGIYGIMNYKNEDIHLLMNKMQSTLHHRGPDDEGVRIFESKRVALGHKRLSIIDVDAGRQPMNNGDNQISIVFNGEIYNYKELRKELLNKGYRFCTNSDTESLLHLYEDKGVDMFDNINGMFAFAVFNNKTDELLLARDRIGIKPLYYAVVNNSFIFASEIQTILIHPEFKKQLNTDAVYKFLHLRCTPSPHTMFKNIFKLEPGCFLKVTNDNNQISIKKQIYWSLEQCSGKPYLSKPDALCEIDNLLLDSVNKRMISDVPIGAFLSGGVDSTMIVHHMAANTSSPVDTYTLGFKNDPKNEFEFARLASRHCQSNHNEILLSQEEYLNSVSFIINCFDDPVADGAALPIYLMSRAAKRGKNIKVMLSGEGCDELFGGYSSYLSYITLFKLYSVFKTIPGFLSKPAIKILLKCGYKKETINQLSSLLHNNRSLYAGHSTFPITNIVNLFNNDEVQNIDLNYFNRTYNQIQNPELSFMEKMFLIDMKYRIPDDLLTRLDRMTMAASVEGRVPFLDHRFVELGLRVNPSMKINQKERKYIIKKVAENHIPRKIIYRQKSGFPVPVQTWLKSKSKNIYKNIIMKNSSNLFNENIVNDIFSSHYNNNTDLIWRLFFFSVWFEKWFLNREFKVI